VFISPSKQIEFLPQHQHKLIRGCLAKTLLLVLPRIATWKKATDPTKMGNFGCLERAETAWLVRRKYSKINVWRLIIHGISTWILDLEDQIWCLTSFFWDQWKNCIISKLSTSHSKELQISIPTLYRKSSRRTHRHTLSKQVENKRPKNDDQQPCRLDRAQSSSFMRLSSSSFCHQWRRETDLNLSDPMLLWQPTREIPYYHLNQSTLVIK
jgi:hypothetical protein